MTFALNLKPVKGTRAASWVPRFFCQVRVQMLTSLVRIESCGVPVVSLFIGDPTADFVKVFVDSYLSGLRNCSLKLSLAFLSDWEY